MTQLCNSVRKMYDVYIKVVHKAPVFAVIQTMD